MVLTMFAGPPGSGKSTQVRQIMKSASYVYLSTDEFIERYARFTGKTYNEVFHKAIKRATKRLKKLKDYAIQNNLDAIWDQTNLTEQIRTSRREEFKNYVTVLIYSNISLAETLRRNDNRERSLDKNIVVKMFKAYELPSEEELSKWDFFRELN